MTELSCFQRFTNGSRAILERTWEVVKPNSTLEKVTLLAIAIISVASFAIGGAGAIVGGALLGAYLIAKILAGVSKKKAAPEVVAGDEPAPVSAPRAPHIPVPNTVPNNDIEALQKIGAIFKQNPAVLPVVQRLIRVSEYGNTAVHLAAWDNNIETLQKIGALIGDGFVGFKFLFAQNHKGHTPLHLAVANDKPEALKVLIEMAKRGGSEAFRAQLCAQDQMGRTAVHLAVEHKAQEALEALLEAAKQEGAETVAALLAPDQDGKTPAQLAAEGKNAKALQAIFKSAEGFPDTLRALFAQRASKTLDLNLVHLALGAGRPEATEEQVLQVTLNAALELEKKIPGTLQILFTEERLSRGNFLLFLLSPDVLIGTGKVGSPVQFAATTNSARMQMLIDTAKQVPNVFETLFNLEEVENLANAAVEKGNLQMMRTILNNLPDELLSNLLAPTGFFATNIYQPRDLDSECLRLLRDKQRKLISGEVSNHSDIIPVLANIVADYAV
jgi:ankyrin repeat protein